MPVPDHYKTLQLEPRATPPEIKKAYRRLAQQFHPDKTSDDPYAAARFSAIKEAYETLSTPWKKQQYLEQRWYAQSRGGQTETIIRTPAAILQEALRLDKEISGADEFRMNKTALFMELNELLNSDNLECLRQFKDPPLNSQLVKILCRPMRLLTYPHALQLRQRLQELAAQDETAGNMVDTTLSAIRRQQRAQQWQWVWIPVALSFLYLLIVFTRN